MIPAFLNHQLLVLYALAFALSAVGTLFNPAKGALIPRLVPAEQLISANALSQTSMMLAQFIGPALAGATFAAAGSGNQWVAFAINALSFLISAVAILLIRVPRTEPAVHPAASGSGDGSAIRQVGQDLLVGLKALVLNRTIVILAVVFAVLNLGLGAINVLWIVFLRTQFGFTAADLAWRISVVDIAFAGGMVLSSVLVGNFAAHVAPKWMIAWGLIVAGLITTVMGALPAYWLVVGAMVLIGLSVGPINTGTTTLMQIVVPNRQLGRVGGAWHGHGYRAAVVDGPGRGGGDLPRHSDSVLAGRYPLRGGGRPGLGAAPRPDATRQGAGRRAGDGVARGRVRRLRPAGPGLAALGQSCRRSGVHWRRGDDQAHLRAPGVGRQHSARLAGHGDAGRFQARHDALLLGLIGQDDDEVAQTRPARGRRARPRRLCQVFSPR